MNNNNSNSKIVINCSANFTSLRIEDPRKSPLTEDGNSNTVHDTQLFMTQNIPELVKHFILEGKIGEGTFSKVYRARLIRNRDRQFALKYLIPTIGPKRIAQELRFLRDLGGSSNVCGVEAALTTNGHTVMILPYFEHDKFPDYMARLTINEIRDYIKNLMIALARIHAQGIIHRDVKPSNFLYNHSLRSYLLVDFGLAQDEQDFAVAKKRGSSSLSHIKKLTTISTSTSSAATTLALKDSTKNVLNTSLRTNTALKSTPTALLLRTNAVPDTKQVLGKAENKQFLIKKRRNDESGLKGNKRIKTSHGQIFTANRETAIIGFESSVFNTPVTPSNPQTPDKTKIPQTFKTPTKPVKKTPTKPTPNEMIPFPTRKSARLSAVTPPSKDPENRRQRPEKPITRTPVKNSAIASITPINANCVNVIPETPLKTGTAEDKERIRQLPKREIKFDDQDTPKSRLQCTTSRIYCECFQRPQICKICLRRLDLIAPRAGTPGFRAPEVLLRTGEQSTAIDIWSAGVIFISLLSGRYPFFRNSDDMTSLSEIISVLGSRRVLRAAKKLGKTLAMDNFDFPASDLRQLCESVRDTDFPLKDVPDSAYELLDRLLDPYPLKRITAEQALKHPFLSTSVNSTPLQAVHLKNNSHSQSQSSMDLD